MMNTFRIAIKASFANDKHQIYDEYFSNCDFSMEMLSRHYKIAKVARVRKR